MPITTVGSQKDKTLKIGDFYICFSDPLTTALNLLMKSIHGHNKDLSVTCTMDTQDNLHKIR